MILRIGTIPYRVNSILDAKRTWQAYEDNESHAGRGGSRAMPDVKLYYDNNDCFARLSYNGRVWCILTGVELHDC